MCSYTSLVDNIYFVSFCKLIKGSKESRGGNSASKYNYYLMAGAASSSTASASNEDETGGAAAAAAGAPDQVAVEEADKLTRGGHIGGGGGGTVVGALDRGDERVVAVGDDALEIGPAKQQKHGLRRHGGRAREQ